MLLRCFMHNVLRSRYRYYCGEFLSKLGTVLMLVSFMEDTLLRERLLLLRRAVTKKRLGIRRALRRRVLPVYFFWRPIMACSKVKRKNSTRSLSVSPRYVLPVALSGLFEV